MTRLAEPMELKTEDAGLLLPGPDGFSGAKLSALRIVGGAPLLLLVQAEQFTTENRSRVEAFFLSIPHLLDTRANRCRTFHARRCYREHVLCFMEHLGLAWTEEAHRLLTTTFQEVQKRRRTTAQSVSREVLL